MNTQHSRPIEKTAATAQSSGRASRFRHRHERATTPRCGGESLRDDSSRPGRLHPWIPSRKKMTNQAVADGNLAGDITDVKMDVLTGPVNAIKFTAATQTATIEISQ